MDFVVEKAAELGATMLWPLECARAVVRDPGEERLARWRRLALRRHQAEPDAAADGDSAAAFGCRGGPRSAKRDPRGRLHRRRRAARRRSFAATRPRAMLIACGPEGDFDPAEYAAMEAAGFVAAGLGPNRLRSETAALAALSVAAGALDEIERGI